MLRRFEASQEKGESLRMSGSSSEIKVTRVGAEVGEFMQTDEPLFDWELRLAGGTNSPLVEGRASGSVDDHGSQPAPPASVLSFWERLRASS